MRAFTHLEHCQSFSTVVQMCVVSSSKHERKLKATQNQELLNDDLYLGLRRPRVRGKEYNEFVDKFVQSVRKLYPGAYLHLYVHSARLSAYYTAHR